MFTKKNFACPALVIHIFVPEIKKSSPFGTATVFNAKASEPLPTSDKQKDPTFKLFFLI